MTSLAIDSRQTLGALAGEHPQLIEPFERLRLDYCCGGGQTLAEACERRGLDPDTVAVVLAELAEGTPVTTAAPHDLSGATIGDICDHVVTVHHEPLRRALPRIAELLATVVRVHGGGHPELHDLQRLFATLERGLLEHLASEEATLFPVVRAAVAGPVDPELALLVAEHAKEHSEVADVLAAMRDLCDGYAVDAAYCSTHRSLLESLAALELDLHRHVHEENNLLFPRVLAVAHT